VEESRKSQLSDFAEGVVGVCVLRERQKVMMINFSPMVSWSSEQLAGPQSRDWHYRA